MDFLANGLAITAASFAALYCMVLSRRLAKLNRLDSGMGASVAALTRQSAELQSVLQAAKSASTHAQSDLAIQTARAERAVGRLEMLLATLHDTDAAQAHQVAPPPVAPGASMRDIYQAMRT